MSNRKMLSPSGGIAVYQHEHFIARRLATYPK